MADMLRQPDEEKRRLAQLRGMGIVGVGMGLKPTASIGEMLYGQAGGEEKLGYNTRTAAAEAQIRAAERAEAAAIRAQEHADLQQYRQDSLDAYGRGGRGQGGSGEEDDGLTPYQRQQVRLRKEENDRQATAARQARVTDLSQQLEKTGMAELDRSVRDANELLSSYAQKGDIPGIGGLSNAPLVGKYFGGEEGKHVRSTIAAVRNAVLKARSGGAVTPEEGSRLYEELGLMLGYGDADLLNAWGGFVQRHNARLSNILAPYRDVLPDYQRANPGFGGAVQWPPNNQRANTNANAPLQSGGGAPQARPPGASPGASGTWAPPAQEAPPDYDFVNGQLVPRRR
jgi:hypothetical protein